MNAENTVFVICVEEVICLLLYNLHDCIFNKRGFPSAFIKNFLMNFTQMMKSTSGGT